MPVNQRSLYSHVLCDECKYKSLKQFCEDCKRNHRKAINAVYYKNKKSISAENKAIISTSSVQSSSNGALGGIDKSDSCVTASVGGKKRKWSKYAYLYYTDCEEKPLNEICVDCRKKYNRVKSNNSYKKLKPSIENIDLNNQINLTGQTQQVQTNRPNQSDPISAYFGHFEGVRAIISNKKLYSLLLLIKTNVLSYISPFYHHFENSSFFNISIIFRPPVQGIKPQNFAE